MDKDKDRLLNEKVLTKLKELKTKFVVVSYDVPSEFKNCYEDKRERFKSLRWKVTNFMNTMGTYLNNSVYVVRLENVEEIIAFFQMNYEPDEYNLKIVGAVFDEVAKELIIQVIEKLKNEIADTLEKKAIELEKATNYSEKLEIKNSLYKLKVKEKYLLNRIEDLYILDVDLASKYQSVANKLRSFRLKLINMV